MRWRTPSAITSSSTARDAHAAAPSTRLAPATMATVRARALRNTPAILLRPPSGSGCGRAAIARPRPDATGGHGDQRRPGRPGGRGQIVDAHAGRSDARLGNRRPVEPAARLAGEAPADLRLLPVVGDEPHVATGGGELLTQADRDRRTAVRRSGRWCARCSRRERRSAARRTGRRRRRRGRPPSGRRRGSAARCATARTPRPGGRRRRPAAPNPAPRPAARAGRPTATRARTGASRRLRTPRRPPATPAGRSGGTTTRRTGRTAGSWRAPRQSPPGLATTSARRGAPPGSRRRPGRRRSSSRGSRASTATPRAGWAGRWPRRRSRRPARTRIRSGEPHSRVLIAATAAAAIASGSARMAARVSRSRRLPESIASAASQIAPAATTRFGRTASATAASTPAPHVARHPG